MSRPATRQFSLVRLVVWREERATWVEFHGELDILDVKHVESELRALCTTAERLPLVLDLRRLDVMDSHGARTLFAVAELARRSGRELRLIPSSSVRRLLDLMGLAAVVAVDADPRSVLRGRHAPPEAAGGGEPTGPA